MAAGARARGPRRAAARERAGRVRGARDLAVGAGPVADGRRGRPPPPPIIPMPIPTLPQASATMLVELAAGAGGPDSSKPPRKGDPGSASGRARCRRRRGRGATRACPAALLWPRCPPRAATPPRPRAHRARESPPRTRGLRRAGEACRGLCASASASRRVARQRARRLSTCSPSHGRCAADKDGMGAMQVPTGPATTLGARAAAHRRRHGGVPVAQQALQRMCHRADGASKRARRRALCRRAALSALGIGNGELLFLDYAMERENQAR